MSTWCFETPQLPKLNRIRCKRSQKKNSLWEQGQKKRERENDREEVRRNVWKNHWKMGFKKGSYAIKQKLNSTIFGWEELFEYNGSQNALVNEKGAIPRWAGHLRRKIVWITRWMKRLYAAHSLSSWSKLT